jgi:hypothetical protein
MAMPEGDTTSADSGWSKAIIGVVAGAVIAGVASLVTTQIQVRGQHEEQETALRKQAEQTVLAERRDVYADYIVALLTVVDDLAHVQEQIGVADGQLPGVVQLGEPSRADALSALSGGRRRFDDIRAALDLTAGGAVRACSAHIVAALDRRQDLLASEVRKIDQLVTSGLGSGSATPIQVDDRLAPRSGIDNWPRVEGRLVDALTNVARGELNGTAAKRPNACTAVKIDRSDIGQNLPGTDGP